VLVQDFDEVKRILEEIKPQLPEALQIKLRPAGHRPFFRAQVESARHRIEARRTQLPLKAHIAQKCQRLNDKKVILDTKADTSVLSSEFDPVNIGQIGSTGGLKANMSFIVNYNWIIVRPLRGIIGPNLAIVS
jgi:hypothetical protein